MTMLRFAPRTGFGWYNPLWNETAHQDNQEVKTWKPRTDISEDEKGFYFNIELPGVSKDDLKVSVNEDKELVIRAEKKKVETENMTQLKSERIYGTFERIFKLPESVDHEHIDAKFENGLLELTLPRLEPPKPKEFEISIN